MEQGTSEDRLRLFVEHAPAAIAMVDRDMRYIAVSRRWLTDYRVTESDLVGRSHYDVFPDLPAHWRDIHRRCLAGAVERSEEEPFPRADGRIDWVKWEIHPWRTAAGEIGGLMLFTEVITRRKEAELALQQRDKLESIGRLAGGIAHDFNNLLTVILSCAEALKEEVAAGRAASAADLDDIVAAGRRAAELTRQLLTFARKQVIAPVPLDLNATLKGLQALLRRVLGERIAIVSEPEPALWTVRCDPVQIEQVVLNLVLNARDAMPAGGTLLLATSNVEVPEGFAAAPELKPGRYVRLTVRDSGHGMSREVQRHAFEPFFTTKPLGSGTGLGLAMAYGVAQQGGGAIAIDSAPGRGTSVDVYLPRDDGRAEVFPEPSALARRGTEAVLVVEDDPLVRGVTARCLRERGYAVTVAASGEEALELIARGLAPRVLVTDVVMPGIDGRALSERVRAAWPDVRVLLMSGYSDEVLGDDGVVDPAIAFLAKPFTPEQLLDRVEALLDAPPTRA
ncbi:MAG TPA: response regulator [Anaeromyxobacteraceae bacterium]|nr:response regulator [Anaeromyxobacteraceae bacterium]